MQKGDYKILAMHHGRRRMDMSVTPGTMLVVG
jgi:hypothetical protein